MKWLKAFGIVMFFGWALSTATELYQRGDGESISIVGQLFFSIGLPYFVFVLVLRWFIRTTGLDRLPTLIDLLEKKYEEPRHAEQRTDSGET